LSSNNKCQEVSFNGCLRFVEENGQQRCVACDSWSGYFAGGSEAPCEFYS
jgi:hypothetical protein